MAEGIKNPDLIRKKERQIARAAAKCFSVNGFNKTAVREIAKSSGLTVGNLYDYIDTKEDTLFLIYKEIYWEWTKSLVSDVDLAQISDPKSQLTAAIEKMLDIYDKYRELMILAIREARFLQRPHLKMVLEQESRLVDYFADIIRRGTDAGIFRKLDPILTANSIIIQFALIPLRGWSIRRHCGEDKVKAFSVDFLVNAILTH